MAVQRPIWNVHNDKQKPTRLCDVLIEDDNTASLVFKNGKQFERIPWLEVVSQVDDARKSA